MRISWGRANKRLFSQRSRRWYRSGNRRGLSRRPLIKDPTSARVNSSVVRRLTRGIATIIKDRSARWPVPGTKREALPLPSFLSNTLFLLFWSTSVFPCGVLKDERKVVGILHGFTFYGACVHEHWYETVMLLLSLKSFSLWHISHHITYDKPESNIPINTICYQKSKKNILFRNFIIFG